MMDMAIIAAAGWKGSGCLRGLAGCPEALLPLGGPATPLSRLARQLSQRGFLVFAGVGQPGCLYPRTAAHLRENEQGIEFITEEAAETGCTVSPWTWERIDYVRRYAIPVLIAEPDSIGTWVENGRSFATVCAAMDAVGWQWDRLLLFQGDTLFSNLLLECMLSLPCPSRLSFSEHDVEHTVFSLDREAAEAYQDGRPRDVQPRLLLAQNFPGMEGEWTDIDYPMSFAEGHQTGYAEALEWVARHG